MKSKIIVLATVGALLSSFLLMPPASAAPTVVVRSSGIVSVTRSGFSAKVTDPEFGSADAQFGLILRNTSSRLAALGIRVTVTFSGKDKGTGWVPESFLLTGIPAGGTFYFSGDASGNPKPTIMRVALHVMRTSSGHLVLPPVTKIAITGSLLPEVAVTVKNPYSQEAMFGTTLGGAVYIVYFNHHGQIVGGDQVRLSPFSAAGASQTARTTTSPPNGVNVRASVDPCGGLDPGCPTFR